MISRGRALIQTVLHRYYYVHHDKAIFEDELVDEVRNSRVRAFGETKRAVIEALDYRIEREMKAKPSYYALAETMRHEAVLAELESVRAYVKGMVVSADENQS